MSGHWLDVALNLWLLGGIGRAVIEPGARADGKQSEKHGPAGSGAPWGEGRG